MMRKVLITRRAAREIDDILSWIVERSVQGAVAWAARWNHVMRRNSMGLFDRIKSALSGGHLCGRRTNRGVLFTLDELEFVDETGEIEGGDYDYAVVGLKRTLEQLS
jgi:plasmid stabilization system protein ParE